MQLEVKKLLFDMAKACDLVMKFTKDKSFEDYQSDDLLRSGVERQLEIAGEALTRARKIDSGLNTSISDAKKIIGFRNVLVHGYAMVSNETVWDIVQNYLGKLQTELASLLLE